jgi:hypothetical protein
MKISFLTKNSINFFNASLLVSTDFSFQKCWNMGEACHAFKLGGSEAKWNMGQNETSLYFCMKQVLKLVSCKNRRMFRFAPCST